MSLNILKSIYIKPIIGFIKLYQLLLSPILRNNCRYLPTCSEYSIQSLDEHGLIKGVYLTFKRILNCNPYGGEGYDPVPKKIRKEN